MHVLLTDVVTCPRCGPDFGLVLLAEKTENRRVLAGSLGCANCRERYRVDDGFADLRFGETNAGEGAGAGREGGIREEALRIAALLGVTDGHGLVLMVGAGAVTAPDIAALVPGIEVVAAWQPLEHDAEQSGVSRIGIGGTLPVRNGSMRGVALTDAASSELIEEAARAVAPRARVVVEGSSPAIKERLERAGLRIIATDERASVAQRTAF